jgi:hypothetical protein
LPYRQRVILRQTKDMPMRMGFIVFVVSLLTLLSCCKKNNPPCLTCPPQSTDTTSHNFIWHMDTLGDGSGSVLYDVAIINDTLAYAVGEIYFRDSLGNWDPNAYNLVKWDGKRCELKRVPFIGPCSAVLYPPLKTIWVFSNTNILVSNGGSIVTYDGTNATMDCRMNSLLTGALNKIFAIDPQNVYVVGNSGSIVYYDGFSWTKILSGTTLSINDINGAFNSLTNQWEILAVGSQNLPLDKIIIKIQGTLASAIPSSPIQYELYSVWFIPNQHYYVVGDGIFEKSFLSESGWKNKPLDFTTFASTKIRGNGVNDIVVVGAYGELLHYNGSTWHSFQSATGLDNGAYTSVAVKNNLVIAVGGNQFGIDDKAIITIGYHQ